MTNKEATRIKEATERIWGLTPDTLAPTHARELLNEIRGNCPSIRSINSHYLVNGICMRFMDNHDGKRYDLFIKEAE